MRIDAIRPGPRRVVRMARTAVPVVLLAESEAADRVAARLGAGGRAPACYRSLEDLMRGQPLSSIAVLVLLSHPVPKGILLVTLARLTLEYPAMQKVAVMEEPPPLPVAEYLTARGVDLLWKESGQDPLERLAEVVEGKAERAGWIAGCPAAAAEEVDR